MNNLPENQTDSNKPILVSKHEGLYALAGDRGALNSSHYTFRVGDETVTLTALFDKLPLWLAQSGYGALPQGDYGAEVLAAMRYRHEVGYPTWSWMAIANKMLAAGEMSRDVYDAWTKHHPRG